MTAEQDDDRTRDGTDTSSDHWDPDDTMPLNEADSFTSEMRLEDGAVRGLDSALFRGFSESYTPGEWGTARLDLAKEHDTPVRAEVKLSVTSGIELEGGGSEATETVRLPADATTRTVELPIRIPVTLAESQELTCLVTYWSEGSRETADTFDELSSDVRVFDDKMYTPSASYDRPSDYDPKQAGLNERLSSLGDRFDNIVVRSAVRAFSALQSLTLVQESGSDDKRPATVHAAELVVRVLAIILGVSVGVFGVVRWPDLFLSQPLAPGRYAVGPSLVGSVLAGVSLALLVVWSQATTFAWPGTYADERRGLILLAAVVAIPAIVVVPTTVGYAVGLLVVSNLAVSLAAAIVR